MSNPTTTYFSTTVGAVSAHGLIHNDVVAIESSGATRLDQVANEFYLRDGTGNGPSLKYAGADVVAGQFGTWTPLGVEKVGSGYQVIWKNGSADQYIVWNVDSSGNCINFGTGVVSGSEYAFQSLETGFQQDFNADGTTGLKTTTIETAGATDLVQVANEFYLHDGAGNGPSLKYAGADVVAGQFGAWTPLGAEKVGSGYQVAGKNGDADQYIVWNVDSNGNATSYATGVMSGSEYAFQSLETTFQQDFNSDGTTGLKTTPLETSGTTHLDQVANEFFLRDGAGNGPSLKYGGADVVAGQFGTWTPLGVEKVGSGYQVIWKNGGADQYIVWNVDSNGNATSYATGVVSGSEYAFQSLETPFQQDFNADGTTGLKTTTIETSGTTRLDQVANEFYLRDGAGIGPSLKYGGADVVAGQFGTWTPLGVEKVGSGYQVIWKNGGADQYIVWNVDSNGNATSYATGVVSGSEYAFQSLETTFQQDFNGDGTTGLKTMPIESSGATRLDQVANQFFLHDSAGIGPSLKYGGADVVAGQFGTWTPLGVEKVGSGYQVIWKNGGADQYIVWNVDSNGNATSYATGVVSGSEHAFQSLETAFQQDLNADDTTGLKTTLIETSGGTHLDQVANEFYLRDSAGNGPSLKYGGADVVAGQFGGWTPLGVEKVGSGYQVVWKNGGADQYIVWNVDSSGNCINYATGVVPGSDPSIQLLETAFQQDLNGDGGPVAPVAFAISALASDKAEAQSGTTPFTFTITRSGDTGSAHSVSWSLTGSGANPASASDFVGGVLPSGTVSFAAGETSKTITVNVASDTVVEASEGFTVTLSNPSAGATLDTASAVGTIRNDDAVLSIATASADKAEGQSGTTPFTFTITRSGDTNSTHSVAWSLTGSGGNPASAPDFVGNVLPSGTVSFAAGETTKTITVNVAGDTVVESDEGFTVTLSNPSTGATLGTASAVGTIRTDDASSPGTGGDNTAPALQSISLSTSQLNIGSGQTSLVVTVHLSDDISGVVDGGATILFRSPSGAHVWGNFDTQHPVSGNQLDGTFQVTIQLPANAEAGNWTVEWLQVTDGAGNMKFLNPSDTPALSSATFQVLNSASDGTAPALQSISLSTSQLNIGSGQTSLVVTVHLSDDISGVVDGGATILFRSPSGAHVWGNFDTQHPVSGNQLDGTFQVTIQLPANAEAGNWTVEWLQVTDGAGNMKFLNPSDTPALSSATFQVLNGASDGTAPALQSISLSTSQLNIGSGQTSLVVTVHLSDDISGVVDGGATILFRSPSGAHVSGIFDTQHPVSGNQLDGTFQVTIQLPANAEAGNWIVEWLQVTDGAGNMKFLNPSDTPALSSATFEVLNSASQSAVFSVEPAQASQVEGQSGTTPFTFTITRTGDTGSADSVSWSVAGSGANPASASDFAGNALPSGTVSFAVGETSKTVTVNVAGDAVVESSEGFAVTLSNPSTGATLGTASAIGAIRNDDAVLSIATASADKAEGQSGTTPFTFTVTRTGDTGAAHSVSWSLTGSGANAASASDFAGNALPSGTVSFSAGETSKTVTVNVAGDTGVESDEGFTVTLSNPSTGATLGTASATGAIRNDDTSSPGTGGDNTAPVLQSISLSTSQLDFGSGQKSLVVTAHLSDDISGLSDGIGGGSTVNIGFRSPSGQTVWATFDIQHPVSGNQLDGTFQATILLPANAEAGTWTIQSLSMADEAGNYKYLTPTDTPALSSATFQVLNSASDNTAPALQSISLSTSQLDFGSGQKSLVVTAHLSDDMSGLSDGIGGGSTVNIGFRSPSGQTVWATFDIQHPVSGNQLDGTFQATIQLPANAEAGTWTIQSLSMADEAGNYKYLTPTDTPALRSATFQVLNSASDNTAPVLQSISLSTSQLDFGSGQKSLVVTAHLSDDISGLSDGIGGGSTVNIGFRSPSGQTVWATFDIQHPVSGNQLDGTFQATIQLPANAEAGTWTIQSLSMADEAGNYKYLTPTDTPALRSATFQVLNSTSGSAGFSVEPAQASQSEGESVTTADTFTVTLDEDNGGAPTPVDGQSHDGLDGVAALSSDGSTAIVGRWSDDVSANTDQGSARVFVQEEGDWTQRGAALTASDGQAEDLFGWSVALSSDGRTAIVGGPGDDVGGHADQGSARVLAWDGNAWTQRGGAITPGDGQAGDHFGASVALSSDGLTVIIGGPQDDVGANIDQGSAYVFAWDGGEWTQRGDALTFGEGGSADHLGSSVALSSDGLTATVGAGGDNAPLVLHWDGFHWI